MSMSSPAHSSNGDENAPRRYIFNQSDMENFRQSPARKELLSFVSAMGRGLTTASATIGEGGGPPSPRNAGDYDPRHPLRHLTPALASLRGSLACMSDTWMDADEGGIPPDREAKARFGNPAFRTWHARLVERSFGIVKCLMDCHVRYSSSSGELTGEQILKECSDRGYRAASASREEDSAAAASQTKPPSTATEPSLNEDGIITELRAYLHDSFGHPIRIDYGTGHESSFIVLLLSLCKIGCFRWGGGASDGKGKYGEYSKSNNQSPEAISLASLSLFQVYLQVTRGLQKDYMLEPAGSHGVWGLDDYHCVPFYLGACQMMAREQWQNNNTRQSKKKGDGIKERAGEQERNPDNPYLPESASPVVDTLASMDISNDDQDRWTPSIIHDRPIVEKHRPTYLYLSCIHFIQQIKPGVPFFESSPMLNDISRLGSWSKVSSGLLRLYEGEVLERRPVVQHFVFGKIFSANWSPSRKAPLEAPTRTFINGPTGEGCVAPWAQGGARGAPEGMPPTRAPWAK